LNLRSVLFIIPELDRIINYSIRFCWKNFVHSKIVKTTKEGMRYGMRNRILCKISSDERTLKCLFAAQLQHCGSTLPRRSIVIEGNHIWECALLFASPNFGLADFDVYGCVSCIKDKRACSLWSVSLVNAVRKISLPTVWAASKDT